MPILKSKEILIYIFLKLLYTWEMIFKNSIDRFVWASHWFSTLVRANLQIFI